MSVGRVAGWFAPAWAAAVAAFLHGAPAYGVSVSEVALAAGGAPVRSEASGTATLPAVNGPEVLLPLLLPVFLAALPLATRRPAWRRRLALGAALALGAFVVLGAASVGVFYAPAAVALGLAAAGPGEGGSRATA